MVRPMEQNDTFQGDYCEDMVRKDDRDRYLASLFAPKTMRADLMALYAFNQEVARTRESVSEPMIGQIRLQWWREAIEQILAGHPREHPVVEALAAIRAIHDIAPLLLEIIDAREGDLFNEDRSTIDDIRTYADQVGGALMEAAMIIGDMSDDRTRRAARACGTAWALCGIVRALPFQSEAMAVFTSEIGTDTTYLTPDLHPKLKPVVEEIAALAQATLTQSVENSKKIAVPARSILLLNVATRHYLRLLTKSDFNPFALDNERSGDFLLIAKMLWASISGKY